MMKGGAVTSPYMVDVSPAGRHTVSIEVPNLQMTVLDFKFAVHKQMRDVHPDSMLMIWRGRRLEDYAAQVGETTAEEEEDGMRVAGDMRHPMHLSDYLDGVDRLARPEIKMMKVFGGMKMAAQGVVPVAEAVEGTEDGGGGGAGAVADGVATAAAAAAAAAVAPLDAAGGSKSSSRSSSSSSSSDDDDDGEEE